MKFKFIAALLLAGASFTAQAGDQTLQIVADNQAHTFNAVIGDGILSNGLDIITLGGLGAGVYNIGLSISGQKLSFDQSSTLNNQKGLVLTSGQLSFFGVEFDGKGPFTLNLAGTAGVGANYNGTYLVSAVPEPTTYAMLLGGLGLLGFMSRRRKAKHAM